MHNLFSYFLATFPYISTEIAWRVHIPTAPPYQKGTSFITILKTIHHPKEKIMLLIYKDKCCYCDNVMYSKFQMHCK